MTNETFEKLERLNAQIDVWIDEEEFDKIEGAFKLTKAGNKKEDNKLLIGAFEGEKNKCSHGKDKKWCDLLSISKPPIDYVVFDGKRINKLGDWSYFFWSKLIRARIQQKGTDCYLRRLDEVVAYLERHLPQIGAVELQTAKLAVIYLLEMAVAGVSADQRSFAERARRILSDKIKDKDDSFFHFYDLLARYTIGVGYFHEARYRKAALEFNWIIYQKNRKEDNIYEKYTDFFDKRLWDNLLYVPAVLNRAGLLLKLQLAYHALKTMSNLEKANNGQISDYKLAEMCLIRAEAYHQMDQSEEIIKQLKSVPDDMKKRDTINERSVALKIAGELLSLNKNNNKTQKKTQKELLKHYEKYKDLMEGNKVNRAGYLQQVAENLNILANLNNNKPDGRVFKEMAAELYKKNKADLVKQEPGLDKKCKSTKKKQRQDNEGECKFCKRKGIDLSRLRPEHYDEFYEFMRKFYESMIEFYIKDRTHKNYFIKDLKDFVERFKCLEEHERDNLEYRKRELDMLVANSKWNTKSNPCLKPRGYAFNKLLSCDCCNNAKSKDEFKKWKDDKPQLKAFDYEKIMDEWDEHFVKHMENHSLHKPDSKSLHFLGLQRWNSSSPAQGRSVGGGYLIYHTDNKGQIDLGIAIDPGFDFVRNLFNAGFSLKDIDIVLLSHAHIDHIRDFESLVTLCLELNNRDKTKHKLHTIMTLGVYRRLKHIIESPGLREFIEPYILDVEKEIYDDFMENYKHKPFVFVKEGSNKDRPRLKPMINGKNNESFELNITPTKAYHNDYSEYSDSFGFKIVIKDEKAEYRIGYTGDTSWNDGIIEQYIEQCNDCDTILVHLGSLIDRKDHKKFEDYKSCNKCFDILKDKNHPYLMGMLHFLKRISMKRTKNKEKPLVLLSEFGEEMRGGIRLDLIKRLKKAYELDILPVDVGLDVLLKGSDNNRQSEPEVWCVQCERHVPLKQVDFENYGYDEALFCVCKTCKKSATHDVLQNKLRRLYEEGRELVTLPNKESQ